MELRFFLFSHVPARLLLLLAASILCGCGDGGRPRVSITGSISVNGVPLEAGMIVFRPLESGAGSGGSAEVTDGRYRLDNVPIGPTVFTFSGTRLTGKSIPGPGGQPEPERVNVIPRKVLNQGLERKVEDDSTQDFSLEGPV
jgi:hypothetical protein